MKLTFVLKNQTGAMKYQLVAQSKCNEVSPSLQRCTKTSSRSALQVFTLSQTFFLSRHIKGKWSHILHRAAWSNEVTSSYKHLPLLPELLSTPPPHYCSAAEIIQKECLCLGRTNVWESTKEAEEEKKKEHRNRFFCGVVKAILFCFSLEIIK